MFNIDTKTNTMTIFKGDTAIFDLTLNNYVFENGDKVYFTVKKTIRDRKVAIKKIVESFDIGSAKFILSGEDTEITPGEYVYDIKCILADGREDTVIQPSKFIVLGGVTDE